MLFRRFAAKAAFGAAAALLAVASPLAAQEVDLRAQVAAFVQPSNEARTAVVVAQLRAAGFEPTVETFTGGNRQTGEMEGRNVVVTLGDGPREILLTAHYDAVKLRDGTMSHGVVDNAASVVGVIEAAKILRGKALNHRIRIILFDQEELGLIGARKWIEAHGLTNVAAVVNSDVAGYGDTLMYGQNNGAQSAFVTRAVQELCAERAMQCVGYPVYPPSDDRAFSAAGAPVVSLGFQDEIGAHQMWLAFNGGQTNGLAEGFVPRVFQLIHSADDTMERIDPATVALAGEVYASVVERLDRQLAGVD
ncbi:MAG: M20/M25/M40 family metallo-hydrolase [Alphaproteobacteria bacterium]|jgi:Zn-dependent M28 family amino/carboxypeptidase|nr:M20/M25/M40 family metallo-hydrolase [Alphaproteobacteria bacterium]MBU2040418.1 M20/M25/M40 family metallo-hydrolase [Alphaproteobacteria bacterium]MBU2127068.1 M20/M25/M40 family metallo-hydrolase [Alphaproteobacteria bacterium]MBU2209023.1 M20/M25/M40 family metallo-hydrolase [Alphaproteobacteria bacterium]MBU2291391.1 M20/M25/M40 family metallo-hydrolase [Alphaproteobacteria bacterium]